LPAVWIPYGSTSISIKIDHEDLAWVFPEGLNTVFFNLNNFLKDLLKEGRLLLMDPTLPVQVKNFLRENTTVNLRELECFDMLISEPDRGLSKGGACLISYPHLDPLIEFRGLGENLFPFYRELWKDFKTGLLEASKSLGTLGLKEYLKELCNHIDLKLIMLAPWTRGFGVLSTNDPVNAYEALENFRKEYSRVIPGSPVEILLMSAGGDPFDESLSRALSIFLNCLRNYSCDRIILVAEGSNGLGLSLELVLKSNDELEMPLVLQYIRLCKNLLNNKAVYFVSAIPESLLKMMLNCKAYETLLDAYKASRLFLPRGSKVGVVTHASLTELILEKKQ